VIHVANTVDYVFLSDSTGHAFFMAHRDADAPPIEPGDVVRLRGHHSDAASRYSTRPFVTDSAVRLASGDPPAPVPATIHEIANGSLDYKFVRTSGLVRDVADSETSREWATLSLFDDGEMLRVAVLVSDTPIERYERLIGMSIEVDGFPNPRGGSPRVFAGRSFHCAGLNAIRILDEPAADPFTAPRIETLVSKTSAQIASSGRVSLRGRVVCTWSDRLAIVKTTDRDFVHLAFDDEQRRAVVNALVDELGIKIGILRSDLRHELVGLLKEGTAGLRAFLRTAELGGSDQLHCLRDLHGAFHGMDAALDVL
jgi:hypothetical protein